MPEQFSNEKFILPRLLRVVLWIIFYLVSLDIIVNIVFTFPTDPEKTPPTFLQGYFEYGRSVEGKIDNMMKRTSLQTKPILGYGWLEDDKYKLQPNKAATDKVLVAVYGMSHTKLLGEAIAKVNSKYLIRNITGPGVPPGWSFAAYQADKDKHDARVVILGIMTDSVAYVSATSGATSYFDMSHPYTFPRYFVENGQLKGIYPPFYTEEGFKDHLYNKIKWADYKDWLSKNDKFYNAILFQRSFADHSALFRILRRAYSENFKDKLIQHIYTKNGFKEDSEEILALRKMVEQFAGEARRKGRLPIIYIVNNEGRGDHLYKALKPVLDANSIPFLSSHIICPPDDPTVFLGTNSHFIPSKDTELAGQIIKIIENMGKAG